jgi:hypothetical protein
MVFASTWVHLRVFGGVRVVHLCICLIVFFLCSVSCCCRLSIRPVASHWQTLWHSVISSTPRLSGIRTHNFSGDSTDFIGNCKSPPCFWWCPCCSSLYLSNCVFLCSVSCCCRLSIRLQRNQLDDHSCSLHSDEAPDTSF